MFMFNRQQILDHGRGLFERFGMGKVLGCAAIGCAVPLLLLPALLCGAVWWFTPVIGNVFSVFQYADPTPIPLIQHSEVWQPAVTPMPTKAPVYVGQSGTLVQVGPTPVYPPDNAQGAIRTNEYSMMGNARAMSDKPMQSFAAYQGSTPVEMHLYLAKANFWGTRRTPYSRGQRLTYPNGTQATIVTGDFDFTLLADQQGQQWYCPPDVTTLQSLSDCMFWR